MKKIVLFTVVILCLSFGLVGCNFKNISDKLNDFTKEINLEPVQNLSSFERYDIVGAPSASPIIMDSYCDEISNYYLIDGGYVKNAPIAYGPAITYTGQTPMSVMFQKTSVSEAKVEEAITKTVSESIQKTNMWVAGASLSITGGTGEKSPIKFDVTATGHFSRTWGTVTDKSNSTTNTFTTAKTTAESITEAISYTVGANGEPVGEYRLTLFATCDIYFIVKTSRDNTSLADCTAIVCARPNTQKFMLDYDVIGADFGKNNESAEIGFASNYYKTLPIPTKTEPDESASAIIPLKTEYECVLNGANGSRDIRIKDGDGKEHLDYITSDLNISALKSAGYTTISVKVVFDIKEIDDGYQQLWILAQHTKNGTEWLFKTYEHGAGYKDSTWGIGYTANIEMSIDNFINQFTLKWGAYGKLSDDWWLGTTRVYVEAKK